MDWNDRFREFASQKERDAIQAQLSPYHTRIAPRPAEFAASTAVASAWSARLFDGPFLVSAAPAHLPAINLVFVQSREGNTGADRPETLGGGATDKHLIYEGLSRVAADAVLAGANTVRGSGVVFSVWHPEMVSLRRALGKPRHPVQIILTERGDLAMDRELICNVPEIPVFVLTPRRNPALVSQARTRDWLRIVETDGARGLRGALETLRSSATISRISAVGGRTAATALLNTQLVQDLYLTTASRPGGDPDTPWYLGSRRLEKHLVLQKEATGPEAGVRFEHWRFCDV
jgi:riboflavin biosynthesis pyrimidine reductase